MTGDCKKPAGLPLLDELDGLVPSWLKEKSKDGPPPLWITLEEDGFFDKLKDAGGHALSQEARFEVSSIVGTGYVELFDRRHREDELRKRRLNAKVAELLADRIEEELQQYHFWIRHPMTELPLRLREYAQQQYPCIPEEVLEKTLFDTPGPELSSLLLSVREAQEELEAKKAKKPGPHPKNYNDRIIEEVAKLYRQIGGRVAVGGGGFKHIDPARNRSRRSSCCSYARRRVGPWGDECPRDRSHRWIDWPGVRRDRADEVPSLKSPSAVLLTLQNGMKTRQRP